MPNCKMLFIHRNLIHTNSVILCTSDNPRLALDQKKETSPFFTAHQNEWVGIELSENIDPYKALLYAKEQRAAGDFPENILTSIQIDAARSSAATPSFLAKNLPAKIEITYEEWTGALRTAFYDGWECGWCASDMASLLNDEEKEDSWETSKTREVAFSARPSATKVTG